MRPLLALIRKDLKLFRADRRAVIVTMALPALLALMFGFIFRGERGEVRVKSRVVDLDGSPASQRLAAALGKDPVLGAAPASRDEVDGLLRRGTIDVAVVIPRQFIARASSGDQPAIELMAGATSTAEAGIARGRVQAAIAATIAGDLGADFARCAQAAEPYAMVNESPAGGDATYDGASHALAGMGVQFILIGAVDSAVGMLNERQRGLFRRLRTAPLARVVLIASRLISGAIIALVVIAFLYAFGSMTLGIAIKGSKAGFALVAVAFAFMASALGLLMATLGKTPQATRGVGIFVVLVATMLSGAWFPAFLFPRWMQTATLFVPTRWAVDGLDAMTWRGLSLADALVPAGVLFLSALLLAGWSALRFRWEDPA
jgi:ABC-2 type transport system permease protein